MEEGGNSSSYSYLDDEDEDSKPAIPTTKTDVRVVQSIYALVVDVVARELRTDEHED
jgi:hypothetical protein